MTDTATPDYFGNIAIPQEDAPTPYQKQAEQRRVRRHALTRRAIEGIEQQKGRLKKVAKRMTLRRAEILERVRMVGEKYSQRVRELEIKIGEAPPPKTQRKSAPSWFKKMMVSVSLYTATNDTIQDALESASDWARSLRTQKALWGQALKNKANAAKTFVMPIVMGLSVLDQAVAHKATAAKAHFKSAVILAQKTPALLRQAATFVLTNKKLIARNVWESIKTNKTSLAAGMATGFVTRSVILMSFSSAAAAMTAPATLTGAATLMGVSAIVGAASSVAREAFSKKEKTGHWVMNAALKGTAWGAVGGFIGGAVREGFHAVSALLHNPVILDAVKPVVATFKDATQGLTTVSTPSIVVPPVVPEASAPLPDAHAVCSDAETFLDMSQTHDIAAQPPTATIVADATPQTAPVDPVHLTAEHAKILHLPVPVVLQEILSQDVFNKLPAAMQREAVAAFHSGNQKSIVHICKEMSYVLMNEVQDPLAHKQGAMIDFEGVNRAGQYGLLDSKDGARLTRDAGINLLTGQNGVEKDVSKGIGELMLADQKDAMVKKFLSLAEKLYPQEFAEAKAASTPSMIEATKAHLANPTAPIRTAAAAAVPLAPTM
ncbi:MAG: hypothetical protein WC612_02470 [Bdellovibrionales bacterium]|jgi:hypothetical protein